MSYYVSFLFLKEHILRYLAGSRRPKIGRNSSERTLQNTENSPKSILLTRLPYQLGLRDRPTRRRAADVAAGSTLFRNGLRALVAASGTRCPEIGAGPVGRTGPISGRSVAPWAARSTLFAESGPY